MSLIRRYLWHLAGSTLNPLFAEPAFRRLWAGVMLASIGAVMLLVALSYSVYQKSGSALLAGLIFSTRWIVSLILLPIITDIIGRFDKRLLVVGALILMSTTSILLMWVAPALSTIFLVIICVRGFIDVTLKSAYSVVLKLWIPTEKLGAASSFFDTSVYLGGAIGSLLVPILLNLRGLPAVALVNALIYLIAALLIFRLPLPLRVVVPSRFATPWRDIAVMAREEPNLFLTLLLLVVSTSLFQGFYDSSRILLPVTHLRLGDVGLGLFQAMTSVAFMAGAFFATRTVSLDVGNRVVWECVLIFTTSITMLLAVLSRQLFLSFICYGLFLMFYEVLFVVLARRLTIESSFSAISSLSSARTVLTGGGLALGTAVTGLLIDHAGLLGASCIVSLVSIVLLSVLAGLRSRVRILRQTD